MSTENSNIAAIYSINDNQIPNKAFFAQAMAAGFPSPAADYMEDEIDFNQLLRPRPASTYVIRVQGDSMKDANIPDQSLLVVDRSIKPVNNQIIVGVVNSDFTIKRLVRNNKGIFLMPANPKYKPMEITEDMNFAVWGTVTKIIVDALKQ